MSNQNQDCRVRFAETAFAHRKQGRLVYFVVVPLMLLFWYLGANVLAVLTFVVLFGVIVYANLSLPKLTCPACELNADCDFVRFCPECGSEKVQTKEEKFFLERPRCDSCSAVLGRKKGERLFKIRFCTRCGAYLDENGV